MKTNKQIQINEIRKEIIELYKKEMPELIEMAIESIESYEARTLESGEKDIRPWRPILPSIGTMPILRSKWWNPMSITCFDWHLPFVFIPKTMKPITDDINTAIKTLKDKVEILSYKIDSLGNGEWTTIDHKLMAIAKDKKSITIDLTGIKHNWIGFEEFFTVFHSNASGSKKVELLCTIHGECASIENGNYLDVTVLDPSTKKTTKGSIYVENDGNGKYIIIDAGIFPGLDFTFINIKWLVCKIL